MNRIRSYLLVALGWVALVNVALAQTIGQPSTDIRPIWEQRIGQMFVNLSVAGQARVIDGDTFAVGDVRVRLWAIDAAARQDDCGIIDGCWRDGAAYLSLLLAIEPVYCEIKGGDTDRRLVARCRSGTRDLGESMVLAGEARAAVMPDGTVPYRLAELYAMNERRGMWICGRAAPVGWVATKARVCKAED